MSTARNGCDYCKEWLRDHPKDIKERNAVGPQTTTNKRQKAKKKHGMLQESTPRYPTRTCSSPPPSTSSSDLSPMTLLRDTKIRL